MLARDRLVSTIVFFGLRNQVFGFPDHIDDAAAAFKEHDAKSARPFNFGSIETYDDSQVQKGNDALAKLIPGQTVRVQAIAKTELDKIKLDEAIGRYVLGVRERNVRVVYLRPWGHQDGDRSIEATNVEMVKQIAGELKSHGFRLGRATPIPLYRGDNRILVGVAALAVPSIFVLLLGVFGWYRRWLAVAAYGLTILVYVGGVAAHHDLFARSVIALAGALLFETAAFLAIAPAFSESPAQKFGDQLVRSIGWTLVALAVALLGALVVVGLMSTPLTMEEIERFRGVKLVLILPALIALVLYLFSGKFDSGIARAKDIFGAPVLAYQLLAGIVVVAAGALLVMRSGNESDIAPSAIELSLRHGLTDVLSVRPRFKTFLVGVPLLMLVPALLATHRRAVGWLLALGIGVGIGDLVDTFSHLHTPLQISLQRIGNGLVIGVIIGIVAIWVYRRACYSFRATTASVTSVTRHCWRSSWRNCARVFRARISKCSGRPSRYGVEVRRDGHAALGRAFGPRCRRTRRRRALGGGGLLQSATSLRSVVYYAGILREAIRQQRKSMHLRQSMVPWTFSEASWFARFAAVPREPPCATRVPLRCSSRCFRARRSSAPPTPCSCTICPWTTWTFRAKAWGIVPTRS